MYIRCKPYKAEEIILQVRKLAVGGNLKPVKVAMSENSWVEMVGEGRLKEGDNLSGIPVEYSDVTGKDAFVYLGPSDVVEPKPALKKKSKAKK